MENRLPFSKGRKINTLKVLLSNLYHIPAAIVNTCFFEYLLQKIAAADEILFAFAPVSFKAFEDAYKALTEKLQPMVFELGFLKV